MADLELNLRYTYHARLRMAEREITEDEVDAVVSEPQVTRIEAWVIVCERVMVDRALRVVLKRDVDPPLVITAMVIEAGSD